MIWLRLRQWFMRSFAGHWPDNRTLDLGGVEAAVYGNSLDRRACVNGTVLVSIPMMDRLERAKYWHLAEFDGTVQDIHRLRSVMDQHYSGYRTDI